MLSWTLLSLSFILVKAIDCTIGCKDSKLCRRIPLAMLQGLNTKSIFEPTEISLPPWIHY